MNNKFYTITQFCRDDIKMLRNMDDQQLFTDEQINDLSHDEMEYIASEMADSYIEDRFWTDLEWQMEAMLKRKGLKCKT